MKSQIIIAVLIAATSASANCIQKNGEHCEWFGSSPFCGSSKSKYGDKDSAGRVLRHTTESFNCGHACSFEHGYISEDCYIDYGYPCLSGYKRLWCYPN
ncbi:hypothetical protein CDV31_014225 [Fusarium ambrosium]|nr:hypothetical protein CDV31_014225 [Fusarium ambrosium]